jgi:hypothetical protein
MYENYFMTLSDFNDLGHEKKLTSTMVSNLETGGYRSWCRDDPELDTLRKAALRAVEDYHDAIVKRFDRLEKRLYDKLKDSDKMLNLKNQFK